jgi:hypothetical protein
MTMNAIDIKIAAVACSLVGTLLLAVRVKRILTALSLVARVHEKNFEQAANTNQIVFTGSTKHLKRAEEAGLTLLVIGFILLVLAAVLNGYALYLDRSTQKSPNKVIGANSRSASPFEGRGLRRYGLDVESHRHYPTSWLSLGSSIAFASSTA